MSDYTDIEILQLVGMMLVVVCGIAVPLYTAIAYPYQHEASRRGPGIRRHWVGAACSVFVAAALVVVLCLVLVPTGTRESEDRAEARLAGIERVECDYYRRGQYRFTNDTSDLTHLDPSLSTSGLKLSISSDEQAVTASVPRGGLFGATTPIDRTMTAFVCPPVVDG